jgi:diketogulonate reductase-like aldo/keto reductase
MQDVQKVMTNNPIVANQVLYNLKRRDIEYDLIPYCVDNNVTVIAYRPLADGSLSGKSHYRPDKGGSALMQVAEEVGKTAAQVALNWCLSRPNVIVIPKTNSVSRTVENCEASGWSLTTDRVAALEESFPL